MKPYFFVLPATNGGYQHNLISLAQGFSQLGIEFGASSDYWLNEDGSYLFQHNPNEGAETHNIIIVSEQYLTYGNGKLPRGFANLKGRKILVHTGDGLAHQYNLGKMADFYGQFDLVLAHLYKGIQYPANFRPWAFGISQHIIDLARNDLDKAPRICVNYRNSHSVRRLAQERIFDRLPKELIDTTREMDEWKLWENDPDYGRRCVFQSAGRHSKGYNERIGGSAATACFGGVFFIKPWIWNWPAFKMINYFVQSAASIGRMQNLATKLGLAKKHTYRIYQWDSWRFWETFANESLVVQIDLEKYGIILAEMPKSGTHYLGADLQQPESAIELLKDTEQMQGIAVAGRQWALEHYSPKAQAERLVRWLNK